MKPLLPNSSLSKQNSVTLVEAGKVQTEPSEVVLYLKPTAAAWRILAITRVFVGLRQDRCWNTHLTLNQISDLLPNGPTAMNLSVC